MEIRMKVSMHGPGVAREPGDLVEVGEEEAARCIAAGFAEEASENGSGKGSGNGSETAGAAPRKRARRATSKAAEGAEER